MRRVGDVSYKTEILRRFYNYSHPVVHQIFEVRYLPTGGGGLMLAAVFVLMLKKHHENVMWSIVFFAASAGTVGPGGEIERFLWKSTTATHSMAALRQLDRRYQACPNGAVAFNAWCRQHFTGRFWRSVRLVG